MVEIEHGPAQFSASFSTSYETDVSSSGLSDSTALNVFTDTSGTLTGASFSSSHQDISQTRVSAPLKQPSRKVSTHSSSDQFISSSNVRMTRSTSKRNSSHHLNSDLELINVEADRQTLLGRHSSSVQNDALSSVESTISQRKARSQNKKKNIRTWKSLNEMDMWQKQWMEKIRISQFSRSAAIAHVTEIWKALTDTYSTLQGRSTEMQQSLRLLACNAIKLVEYFTIRGYQEVSALLPEFMLCVIGVYLERPRHLNELARSWFQSREILRMVCEIPSNIDILICVLTTVGEAKLRFIKTMTSDCIDRDIGSMNLAISEMNDLELRTSQRIQQLQRKEAFGLPT